MIEAIQNGVVIYDRRDFVARYPEKLAIACAIERMSDVAWDCDIVMYVSRGTRGRSTNSIANYYSKCIDMPKGRSP